MTPHSTAGERIARQQIQHDSRQEDEGVGQEDEGVGQEDEMNAKVDVDERDRTEEQDGKRQE